MIFTKWCKRDFWTHGCFLLRAPVGVFPWPSLCLWCSLHCPNYRPQAPRARHAACSLGYTQEPSTNKTKSPFHYITLRFWADAKAWGEGSETIFAKLDTISLELVSLLGLGPVKESWSCTAWLNSDSALRCGAKEVVVVIIIISSSSSSSSSSSNNSWQETSSVLLVNSSCSNSSSRQVNKTWGGGGGIKCDSSRAAKPCQSARKVWKLLAISKQTNERK